MLGYIFDIYIFKTKLNINFGSNIQFASAMNDNYISMETIFNLPFQ